MVGIFKKENELFISSVLNGFGQVLVILVEGPWWYEFSSTPSKMTNQIPSIFKGP